jgi:uncharacterized circularly permuted ATP-grasp superfamily protein
MQKYDEMYTMLPFDGSDVRDHYKAYAQWLAQQPAQTMQRARPRQMIFRRVGITFAVYGDKDESGAGTERLIPFDLIPRIIPGAEWARMQAGLVQRVTALNRFIHDVYHGQDILRAGMSPELIATTPSTGPRWRAWTCRTTSTRTSPASTSCARNAQGEGEYYVLEDNLRVPSGVSYMLENRKMMMRLFPELFSSTPWRRWRTTPTCCWTPCAPARRRAAEPTVVVLTPGMYNSAYFEHAFLAQQMGVELVEGQDLVVKDKVVYMRTTRGLQRVDVIYRRVDDDFLDPQVFRPTPRWAARADGRLPRRQRHHLQCRGHRRGRRQIGLPLCAGDDPLLPGRGAHPQQRAHLAVPQAGRPAVRAGHLHELVVKEVHGAGGYGMLIGPAATKAEIEDFRRALLANPAGYIAQPTLSLSTCPTMVEAALRRATSTCGPLC